jgi:F0F1-type ATP synthase assembly protein I
MVSELVAATLTWGAIGWLLDRWLGTEPWFLSIGFLLGWATGFYLVYLRSMGRIGTAASSLDGPETDRSATDRPATGGTADGTD